MSNSDESRMRLRFNLKVVFLVMTVAAILLAPVRWFGGAYLISILFSLALLLCCILAYWNQRRSGALGIALAGAILGFPLAMGLLIFFLHALTNAIVCAPLALLRVRPTIFATITTVLFVTIYGYSIWHGVQGVRELQALKAQYPFESLDERLTFERESKPVLPDSAGPIHLTSVVSAQLDAQDDAHEPRYYSHSEALRDLHEHSARQFARSAGFGFARMPSVQERVLERAPRRSATLPRRLAFDNSINSESQLFDMHNASVYDFISPERVGYVRSRSAVAGFDSHGFDEFGNRRTSHQSGEPNWQITRLELVSLLRHDEPRVYVAKSLPQMDQLGDVPHRELNEFEQTALRQLETQVDIVFDQQPGRIQMLGSLRAGKTCLECHDGTRGKLLGAFSYEIQPAENSSETTDTEAAQTEESVANALATG